MIERALKWELTCIIALTAIIFLAGCTGNQKPAMNDISIASLMRGVTINTDIQSPHPYPNSDGGSKLVWEYILSNPNATTLELHIKKLELNTLRLQFKTYIDNEGRKIINKSEIKDNSIYPVTKLDIAYPDNYYILPEDMEFVASTFRGDYVIIRDGNRKIISIIGGRCPHEQIGYEDFCYGDGHEGFFVIPGIKGSIAIIELYADSNDTGYGLYIDRYVRGFTPEEKEQVNRRWSEINTNTGAK